MNCLRCGGQLGEPEAMTVPFRALPGVQITGIMGQRCLSCGDIEYEIPRVEELIQVLREVLVLKKERLTGAEVRFLRKALGWSAKDLAARMGVASATVSRWESDSQSMNETADRLLRMFVLHMKPMQDYTLEQMEVTAIAEPSPFTCVVELRDMSWSQFEARGDSTTTAPLSALVARQKLDIRQTARR